MTGRTRRRGSKPRNEMASSIIDRSFFERKKLQTLIERASAERISPEELESIGLAIRETGRRGSELIVRRLWSERRAEAIRRYTYLLDFFEDDDLWMDELIEIALTRRDLDEEGRNALYQALEEFGVDTRSLPLENIPPLGSISAHEVIGALLDAGTRGTARVIADIFALDPEFRPGVIEELSQIEDPRVADLLYVLTSIDDPDISTAAVKTLCRIRSSRSRALLSDLAQFVPDHTLRAMAERGERRLAFQGVPEPREEDRVTVPSVSAYAGCPDSNGTFDLLMVIETVPGRTSLLFTQLHEENGMVAAMVDTDISDEARLRKFEEFRVGSEIIPIPRQFAFELIRDAIARTREQEMFLPPDYYALRWKLRGADQPFERRPERRVFPESPSLRRHWFLPSRPILDSPFFGVMLELSATTYDLAEKWLQSEGAHGGGLSPRVVETYVDQLIDEVIAPKLDRIPGRLLLAAEILERSGGHDSLVRSTLTEAAILQEGTVSPHRSPFIRRLAFESLCAAREGLTEGYDPRIDQGADTYEW